MKKYILLVVAIVVLYALFSFVALTIHYSFWSYNERVLFSFAVVSILIGFFGAMNDTKK
jgi:hypothetical protein